MIEKKYENYIAVIGTGPVGLTVTYNLLKKNKKVCLIDVSSNKYLDYESIKSNKTKISYSYNTGGLSNYWGANVDLFDDIDLTNWPIETKELYENINLLDEICHFVKNNKKIKSNKLKDLKLDLNNKNNKLKKLIDNYSKNVNYFKNNNIEVSNATHFVNKKNFEKFNSKYLLEILLKNNNLKFLQNYLFLKYKEKDLETTGTIFEINKKKHYEYKFKKILICAGSINSTLIFARSSKNFNHKFLFSGNNLIVAPVFSIYGSVSTSILSKFYINYKIPKKNSKIHIQLYDFNKEYLTRIENKFLFIILKFVHNFFPYFINRTFINLIYQDSNSSDKLEVEFSKDYFLNIKNVNIIYNKKINKKIIMNDFKKLCRKLNLLFFSFFSFSERIGACNHLGSSLPMNIMPNKFQTDMNGRIYNCKNIHILDSSILPSIPAKPITFITILNALRITNNLFNNKHHE